jgi:hypothetical protein
LIFLRKFLHERACQGRRGRYNARHFEGASASPAGLDQALSSIASGTAKSLQKRLAAERRFAIMRAPHELPETVVRGSGKALLESAPEAKKGCQKALASAARMCRIRVPQLGPSAQLSCLKNRSSNACGCLRSDESIHLASVRK